MFLNFSKVSFTGSIDTGKLIAQNSSRDNVKPVTLELGGKSACIVCEDADLEVATNGALMANFYSQGLTTFLFYTPFLNYLQDKYVLMQAKFWFTSLLSADSLNCLSKKLKACELATHLTNLLTLGLQFQVIMFKKFWDSLVMRSKMVRKFYAVANKLKSMDWKMAIICLHVFYQMSARSREHTQVTSL